MRKEEVDFLKQLIKNFEEGTIRLKDSIMNKNRMKFLENKKYLLEIQGKILDIVK